MNKEIKKVTDEAKRVIKSKNDEIRLLRTKLTAANGDRSVVFKMPADMTIGNFPALQLVRIENQKDVQSVHIANLKDMPKVEFPRVQTVRLANEKEMIEAMSRGEVEKASAWVPQLVIKAGEVIMLGIAKMIGKGVPVTLSADERMKPMTVVIVDLEGKPVDLNPRGRSGQPSPSFPMVMHGNVTTIAGNCVSGRIVIATPGTRIQLPNVGAKRVVFTCPPANAGTIAIGGKTVSAQAGSETGSLLYPLGTAQIDVNSGNVLWVDGSNAGDVITYNILS